MVHLDLKEGNSFKDVNVDQDGRWFERGLKETVYVDPPVHLDPCDLMPV